VSGPELNPIDRAVLAEARRATLVTIGPGGQARPVPVCYAILEGDDGSVVTWTPIDEKPKRSADPLDLARIRDILERREVAILVDRWDEDWQRLAWVRLAGVATVVPQGDSPDRAAAIAALRLRYPQYRAHDLESRPLIRVAVSAIVSWHADAEAR
jgi:PPOX class probable F420-dependent enzyme